MATKSKSVSKTVSNKASRVFAMPVPDNTHARVSVSTKKIDNGYLVTKEIYTEDKRGKGNWKEETMYSRTKPIIKTNIKLK